MRSALMCKELFPGLIYLRYVTGGYRAWDVVDVVDCCCVKRFCRNVDGHTASSIRKRWQVPLDTSK